MTIDHTAPFQNLRIDQIVASKTNPRKRFTEDKLQELADNIKQHGIMQPILVRPVDGKNPTFELVAGERRWRASKLAGREFIPAMVREMHDLEALQLQVFENLHRSDLHPMEEAEGFSRLLRKSQDLIGLSADELAQKVGKSRGYIYASLKLLELSDGARTAFIEGKFSASVALLIARIPGAALQAEAIKHTQSYDGSSVSYREAARVLQNRFTLNLERALFDTADAGLVEAAGSCTLCAFRSGNCRDICPDIESADVCTKPDCFELKRMAHAGQLIETANKVITGKEADEIMPYGSDSYLQKGYCIGKTSCGIAGLNGRTFEDLLGDALPEPTIIVNDKGHIARAFQRTELDALVQAKINIGHIVVPPQALRELKPWEIERAAREAKQAPEVARRLRVFNALADNLLAAPTTDLPLRSALAYGIRALEDSLSADAFDALAAAYGLAADQRSKFIDDFLGVEGRQTPDLIRMLSLMTIADGVDVPYDWDGENDCDDDDALDRLESMAVGQGIDPDFAGEVEPESGPYPSTAAQAQEQVLLDEGASAFDKIKARELAKRNRRHEKKESAGADLDHEPAAVAAGTSATIETVAA